MRIAITGGIASGKSTALDCLRHAGFSVLSADQVAKEVRQTPNVQQAIQAAFGLRLPIDPNALFHIISRDHASRRKLNRLLHQEIRTRIEEAKADFVEIPLLIEGVSFGKFDQVWMISCPDEIKLARLRARYPDKPNLELPQFQLSDQVKEAFSDQIFDGTSPKAEFQLKILKEAHLTR